MWWTFIHVDCIYFQVSLWWETDQYGYLRFDIFHENYLIKSNNKMCSVANVAKKCLLEWCYRLVVNVLGLSVNIQIILFEQYVEGYSTLCDFYYFVLHFIIKSLLFYLLSNYLLLHTIIAILIFWYYFLMCTMFMLFNY